MTPSATPWFYHAALSQRFALDLHDAVSASRITPEQQLWLQRLVDDQDHDQANEPLQPLPRVDRLITDTDVQLGAELACAWLISDPADADAPLFLSSMLSGIERFADRNSLHAALMQRMPAALNRQVLLEAERIEGNPFVGRMHDILEQQAGQLQALSHQLDSLPSLPTAIGSNLQEQLAPLLAQSGVNVFEHLLQVVRTGSAAEVQVAGTLTLADAAYEDYGPTSSVSVDPLKRRFFDAQGRLLDDAQAQPWVMAMAAAGDGLAAHYERLLEEYWSGLRNDGLTVREFAAQAMADAFAQHILRATAEQTLTRVELQHLAYLAQNPYLPPDQAFCRAWQLSLVLHNQGSPKLAGVCVLELSNARLPGLYLFSALDGVRRFTDRQQLEQHFSTAVGLAELTRFTSLNEHADLQIQTLEGVRLDLIEQPLFVRLLDSIIALQKRNLQYVCGLAKIQHQRAAVRIDDALDVRHLLDGRLAGHHDNWRWSAGLERFEPRWAATHTVVEYTASQLDTVMYLSANSWYGQLSSLDLFVDRQCQLYDHVAGCMRLAINRYLAVLGEQVLDARDLWVHAQGTNTRLISLVLERLSGYLSTPLPVDSTVSVAEFGAGAQALSCLPVDLLELIVVQVCNDFERRYDWHLRSFFARPLRWLDTQVRPKMLNGMIRDCALRLSLSMERRRQEIDEQSLDMFQQILDRPTQALRQALGEQRVEVYGVQVFFDPAQPGLLLADVLILNRVAMPGQYTLWALCDGLSGHDSLEALQQNLAGRFKWPGERIAWMQRLSDADQQRLQRHLDNLDGPLRLTVSLQPMTGHFIEQLQQLNIERHCERVLQVCQRALPRQLSADHLRYLLKESECADPHRQLLDQIGMTMELMITDALLPPWMKEASLWELFTLSALIKRWYIACNSGKDFLFDIPDPHEYTRNKLLARLHADFPDADVDPDWVTVTLTRYIPAPVAIGQVPQGLPAATSQQSASLTDFAIGRFSAIQDGVVSVASNQDHWSAEALTPEYLHNMVRELDVAAGFRALLKQTFSLDDPQYAQRLTYYCEQVPPLELFRAYSMLMRKQLSDDAYRFIEGIMLMPDGIGRVPVAGRDIIISPVQLLATSGVAADLVPGLFIVAPQEPQPGPWLLYALFNADFVVEEYADKAALLNDIHRDPKLQKFILERLPEHARRLYDHGGFMEPHLPFSTEGYQEVPWETPGPVQLVITPVQGNALHVLFESTGQLLRSWFNRSSVTSAEDDHLASQFLWAMGAEQVLALLPGRLGALVGLWQSESLLHASAADVVQMQWSKAAAELLAAVGVLITTHRSTHETLLEVETLVPGAEPEPVLELPQLGWGRNALSPQVWSRLRPYQVHDVALDSLTKDPLFNTYKNAQGDKTYASVEGDVYQIEQDEVGWFIVGSQDQGPRISLNQQQWQLNLQLGLRGGGSLLTRIKSSLIDAEVDDVLIVEARGIAEIRRKYRTRAQDIALAHALARDYLENSLDNLTYRMPDGTLHMRIKSILKDFFDMPEPDERLHQAVSSVVRKLYSALMDGTLSPFNSMRYVVGVRRSSQDDSTAFTFPKEVQKRIYLTDRFFRDPVSRLKPHVINHGRFNTGIHSRATTLVHELSHLYCATEDMAYLDAHQPFIDLLEDNSDYRRTLKNEIVTVQHGLSYRTPRSSLFRQLGDDGQWYDITDAAKRKVLEIAGTSSLEAARDVFYSDVQKRSDIILGNADSVALLVSFLGRERLVA